MEKEGKNVKLEERIGFLETEVEKLRMNNEIFDSQVKNQLQIINDFESTNLEYMNKIKLQKQ